MEDKGHFEQGYNAQAAVDTATMLIVGGHLTDAANDKQQLQPGVAAISPVVGGVVRVLVDSGYYSETAVQAVEGSGDTAGPVVYAAQQRQPHGRSVADLEQREDPPEPPAGASLRDIMAHRVSTKTGRKCYALRKQTVEPVFGIIKEAMGFRRFMLRGLEKVSSEWALVRTAYNLKRLHGLKVQLNAA